MAKRTVKIQGNNISTKIKLLGVVYNLTPYEILILEQLVSINGSFDPKVKKEIAKDLKFKSVVTLNTHIDNMRKKGVIKGDKKTNTVVPLFYDLDKVDSIEYVLNN